MYWSAVDFENATLKCSYLPTECFRAIELLVLLLRVPLLNPQSRFMSSPPVPLTPLEHVPGPRRLSPRKQ